MGPISDKTIGRLSLYRHLLHILGAEGVRHVYSHQLAAVAGASAAQVRRDLMTMRYSGNPARGYDVGGLIDAIGRFLDAPTGEGVALVGVGNLGRAILAYFQGRRPHLAIVAAFDRDPQKVNRVIQGCRCYPVSELAAVVRERGIRVAILTVPAEEAQKTAGELMHAGVRGIINFAPVRLRVLPHVFVEDIDFAMSLEKVAYFARQGSVEKGTTNE